MSARYPSYNGQRSIVNDKGHQGRVILLITGSKNVVSRNVDCISSSAGHFISRPRLIGGCCARVGDCVAA